MKSNVVPSPLVSPDVTLAATLRRMTRAAVGALALGIGLCPATAGADAAVYDGMNYTPGAALQSENGGTGWSNSWQASANYVATSGSLSFEGLVTSGNKVSFSQPDLSGDEAERTVGAPNDFGAAGTTTWVSILVRPDQAVGAGSNGGGEFSLDIDNFVVGQPAISDTDYSLGAGGLDPASTVPIVAGQTAFLVIEMQFNASTSANDTISLFVNPTPGLAAPDVPAVTLSNTNLSNNITDLAFYAANNEAVSFDELRLGDTFADVSPVPEPGTWGALAVGAVALGGTAVRQRMGRRV